MLKRLTILLIILLIPVLVNAQVVNFPNGSFEDNNGGTGATNWFFTGNAPSFGSGSCSGNMHAIDFPTNHATNGFYSIHGAIASGKCLTLINSLQEFPDGNYNLIIDYNKEGGGANNLLRIFRWNGAIDTNATNVCTAPTGNGVGTFTCNVSASFDFNVGVQFQGIGGITEFWLDNFRYEIIPTMVMEVEEESDPFPIDTNFSLTNEIFLDTNSMEVIDATCNLVWGGSNFSFPYNPSIGKYEFTRSISSPQTINYNVGCKRDGYTSDQNITGSVTFSIDLSTGNRITVTDISNVSHSIQPSQVNFNPSNVSDEIIYSIQNNYTSSLEIPQNITNFLQDGKQYFIYTATQAQYDAGTWVFNDSLTFGITNSDPIQKVWNGSSYDYSFTDSLLVGQKKYYKLTYRNPYKYYSSLNDTIDWYNVFQPINSDSNSHNTDVFQVSGFSNIRSVYIEQIPSIKVNGFTEGAYELQFTAWADSAVTISAGQTIYDSDSVASVSLTSTPTRYSFTISGTNFNSQILLKSSATTAHTIYIQDYAIVPRRYFTKRLEISKTNGDPLDLFLLNNHSNKYVQEGNPLLAKTQAYDRESFLRELRVETYFDQSASDINKVFYQTRDLTTADEKTFDFSEEIPGIIDLNGTATFPTTPRDLTFKVSVVDSEGIVVAEQSQSIKFVQFPYFGGDFSINFFPSEKRRGKNPAGLLEVSTKNPGSILGFDIRIYDRNSSLANPDYQKQIYNGTDFDCTSSNCNMQLKIDDYLYEDANLVHFVVTAILNTEYLSSSLSNRLVQVDRIIYLSLIDFDIAKIYQVVHRADRTYRNDEEIPLVLILRDSEADSLKDKLDIYLTLQNCNASDGNSGNCVNQSLKYKPTGFIYDDKLSLNYYFFRHLYVLDNGSLLPDGNYIGFRANVSDKSGVVSPAIPVLTDKCRNNSFDLNTFYNAVLTFNILGASEQLGSALTGCNEEQFGIVTTTENSAQERRILIDEDHVVSDPSQELFACVAPNINNVFEKPLEQDVLCFVWYEVAESPIDNFRMRLTNQFSDVSIKDSAKQYVEFNVPYEVIAYNDVQLLRQELKVDKDTTINTVGEFFIAGVRSMAGSLIDAYGLNDTDDFLDGNSLITNVGADYDFDQAFSPATVSGAMFFRIKGVPIVNTYNYARDSDIKDIFDSIDRKSFIKTLQDKGISVRKDKAELEVLVSGAYAPVTFVDKDGVIVIDVKPKSGNINTSNLDGNNTQQYTSLRSLVNIGIQNTMFWNNFSESESRSLTLQFYVSLEKEFGSAILDFIDDLGRDPINTIYNWLKGNLVFLMIVLGLLLIGGAIYYLWKK